MFLSQTTRLEQEREKLKRVRGHVDLDGRHVAEAEERLKSTSASRSTVFVEARKHLVRTSLPFTHSSVAGADGRCRSKSSSAWRLPSWKRS